MPPRSPAGRLYLEIQPTSEEVFEPDAVSDAPLIRFIAYSAAERLFGWVRLRADRLTDLLNSHAELHLAKAELESLETGRIEAVEQVLLHRADLVAVHATGSRGNEALHHRTRTHPVAVQSGNYLIGGLLHTEPGIEPIASLATRPTMVALTDAWIEYWSRGVRRYQSTGTIIVNRHAADWVRSVTEDDLIEGGLRPLPTDRAGSDRTGS